MVMVRIIVRVRIIFVRVRGTVRSIIRVRVRIIVGSRSTYAANRPCGEHARGLEVAPHERVQRVQTSLTFLNARPVEVGVEMGVEVGVGGGVGFRVRGTVRGKA